jgi:hypothetical protein
MITRILLIPFWIGEIKIQISHPAFVIKCATRGERFDHNFSDKKWDENNSGDHGTLFQLPSIVYELWSMLESLKLYSCSFGIQNFVKFTTLKDVSLGWIEVSTKTLGTLLSPCRTIESLGLEKCWNLVNFNWGDEPVWLTRLMINKCDLKVFHI